MNTQARPLERRSLPAPRLIPWIRVSGRWVAGELSGEGFTWHIIDPSDGRLFGRRLSRAAFRRRQLDGTAKVLPVGMLPGGHDD